MEDITAATVPIMMSPFLGTENTLGCLMLAVHVSRSMIFSPTVAALTMSPSSNVFAPASYSSMEAMPSPGSITDALSVVTDAVMQALGAV